MPTDPADDEPLVVFESVDLPLDPPPQPKKKRPPEKKRVRPERDPSPPPAAPPRARKKRRTRPPAEPARTPPPRSLPPRSLPPRVGTAATPAAPRKSPRREPKRKRRPGSVGAAVGLVLASGFTLAVLAMQANTLRLDLATEEGISVTDVGRWCLTAWLLTKFWGGRNWARWVLFVLMLFGCGFAFTVHAAIDRQMVGRWHRLEPADRDLLIQSMKQLTVLTWTCGVSAAGLATPWIGTFLARRRGEG